MRVNSIYGWQSRVIGNCGLRASVVFAAVFLSLYCLSAFTCAQSGPQQATTPETLEQKVERLTAAMTMLRHRSRLIKNNCLSCASNSWHCNRK